MREFSSAMLSDARPPPPQPSPRKGGKEKDYREGSPVDSTARFLQKNARLLRGRQAIELVGDLAPAAAGDVEFAVLHKHLGHLEEALGDFVAPRNRLVDQALSLRVGRG